MQAQIKFTRQQQPFAKCHFRPTPGHHPRRPYSHVTKEAKRREKVFPEESVINQERNEVGTPAERRERPLGNGASERCSFWMLVWYTLPATSLVPSIPRQRRSSRKSGSLRSYNLGHARLKRG